MSEFVTNKNEVYQLAAEVNAELLRLNVNQRISANSENDKICIVVGSIEQIERGCAQKGLGNFRQPKQALQFLNGFLAAIKIINEN
jgi:hypothetical protein